LGLLFLVSLLTRGFVFCSGLCVLCVCTVVCVGFWIGCTVRVRTAVCVGCVCIACVCVAIFVVCCDCVLCWGFGRPLVQFCVCVKTVALSLQVFDEFSPSPFDCAGAGFIGLGFVTGLLQRNKICAKNSAEEASVKAVRIGTE